MNEFAYSMPDQKELQPYKAKAALIFGYGLGFGSLLLWTGEKFASLILVIPAFLYAIILNGPTYAKTQTTFDRQSQMWIIDFALVFVLIAIAGGNLAIASTSSASSKRKEVEEKRAF